MTKKEINQIYYIDCEIKMWERQLKEMREKEIGSVRLDGMPRGMRIPDPTAAAAVTAADIENIIKTLLDNIQQKKLEIYQYIETLEDSILRQIIAYRCMSLCTWDEVARNIGGRNTAESVRKIFERHFAA